MWGNEATSGEPTFGGDLVIYGNSGNAFTTQQNGGLEFKNSATGNGYGWRIIAPDLNNSNTPLVYQYRVGSATWTEGARFSSNVGEVNGVFGLGIGTTTPYAAFSLAGLAGASESLVSISTSTSAFSTTTVFAIDQNGNTTIGNNGSVLTVNGATSTYANGINLANGCFSINGTCFSGTNYWTSSGNNLFNNTGSDVGINNSTPVYALDVAGFINTGAAYGYKQAGNTILYATSTADDTFGGVGAGTQVVANGTSTSITSGPDLTAFGYNALGNATSSAYRSTAVGYDALLGSATAGGSGSFGENTAVGYNSLLSVTSGNQNTALGYGSLDAVTTGTINIGIGLSAGNGITTGNQSIALGDQSQALHNGGANIGIGSITLNGSGTGGNNIAIGNGAGNADTSGGNNIFLGTNTASTTATGSNNIALGYDINLPSLNGSNQLDVGNLLFGTGINGQGTTVSTGDIGVGTSTPYSTLEVFGPDSASSTPLFTAVNNSSTTVFAVFDGGNAELSGTLTQSSDQRLKTNISSLNGSSSLAEINALNPITFNWIDPNQDNRTQFGFIAQQVQGIFPSLVSTTSPTALTPNGTLGLNYIDLISPIVAAIQELDQELTSLASTVAGFAENIVTQHLTTNDLCVADSGGTTCITRSQLDALLTAANQSASASPSPSSSPAPSAASDTPPVIQINGDNPAVIQVGASYTDLGATITGPQADLNLGTKTYLNATPESPIELDTSAAATDTIAYVVTDSQGLTSTSTRTVIVEPAAASPTPPPAASSAATSSSATSTVQ